jgi:hypothetical protein
MEGGCYMFEESLKKMPALEDVIVSEKALTRVVTENEVFQKLISRSKTIQKVDEPAQENDFVRFLVTPNEEDAFEKQVVLGKGCFKQYESALMDMKTGEEKVVNLEGRSNKLKILSVKRIYQMEISDESVSKCGIPGVKSISDYKQYFINKKEDELRTAAVGKIYAGIAAQLKKNALYPNLEDAYTQFYELQRQNFIKQCGGNDDKYLQMLKSSMGKDEKSTLEDCEKELYNKCKDVYNQCLIGKAMAEKKGIAITSEMYEQDILSSSKETGNQVEAIKAAYPYTDYLMGKYMESMYNDVLDYYKPMVKIVLE